jgi:hypothetical protein
MAGKFLDKDGRKNGEALSCLGWEIVVVFCRPFMANNRTRMFLRIYGNESEYLWTRDYVIIFNRSKDLQ